MQPEFNSEAFTKHKGALIRGGGCLHAEEPTVIAPVAHTVAIPGTEYVESLQLTCMYMCDHAGLT